MPRTRGAVSTDPEKVVWEVKVEGKGRVAKSTEKEKAKRYVCSRCGQNFPTKAHCARHQNTCLTTIKKIPCEQCPKLFKFSNSLKLHIKEEHSTGPGSVACAQCSVRCPDKKTLIKHITNIHNRKLHSCPYCKQTFVRSYHVIRHLNQKGCNGKINKQFKCEICSAKYSRKDNLLVHLKLHVKNKYKCKECNYDTNRYSSFLKHHQQVHMGNRFICDVCGKETHSRAAMVKHFEIHGEKKYACEECGYSTFTIEVIRRHVLRHTRDKPYKCNICTASFIQVSQLRRHLIKHVGDACTQCMLSFSTKQELMEHKIEHHGLERTHCPYDECKYNKTALKDETALKKHLATHTKIITEPRSHVCEVCNKAYPNESLLRKHLESHRLERPRRCMYCVTGRAFARGLWLVRHVRTKHPNIFADHLAHVREVTAEKCGGVSRTDERVRGSELVAVLQLLDAVADRIMEQNAGGEVLYGGMMEEPAATNVKTEKVPSPLMSEAELEESLRQLLAQLIDQDTLSCFGWPDQSVDLVLEKVIEQCGQQPADRARFSRVSCLRENAKHLFVHVVEDKAVCRMLETHTIDQVVRHILDVSCNAASDQEEVSDDEDDE